MNGTVPRTTNAGLWERRLCHCLLLALFSMTALPAAARQEPTRVMSMADLLSGTVFPIKRKVGDLKGPWRKLRERSADAAPLVAGGQSARTLFADYYTQGETVLVGTQTFLIAYRVAADANLPASAQDSLAPSRRLNANTELDLTLLNLATVHSLTHIEPINAARDLPSEGDAGLDRLKAQSAGSLANARKLALGLTMYAQDYNESFPPTAAQYKQAIMPYVMNEAVFTSPADENGVLSYSMNRRLQGRPLSEISEPARTILLYEGKDEQPRYRYAGKAVVAFVDGHVKLCSPEQVATYDWGKPLSVQEHLASRAAVPSIPADQATTVRSLRLLRKDGTRDAIGTIHNVSTGTWSHVRVSIGVLDRTGKRLATVAASTTDLKPSADWHFKIPVHQKTAIAVKMDNLAVSDR